MLDLHTTAPWLSDLINILFPCRYIIPGGSAGVFTRDGYKFDVGSSMMFGMGQQGTTNLITKALQAVGKELETLPDPTQIHYHLPKSAAHPEVPINWSTFVLVYSRAVASIACVHLACAHVCM